MLNGDPDARISLLIRVFLRCGGAVKKSGVIYLNYSDLKEFVYKVYGATLSDVHVKKAFRRLGFSPNKRWFCSGKTFTFWWIPPDFRKEIEYDPLEFGLWANPGRKTIL
jgi:hypothetical protein